MIVIESEEEDRVIEKSDAEKKKSELRLRGEKRTESGESGGSGGGTGGGGSGGGGGRGGRSGERSREERKSAAAMGLCQRSIGERVVGADWQLNRWATVSSSALHRGQVGDAARPMRNL